MSDPIIRNPKNAFGFNSPGLAADTPVVREYQTGTTAVVRGQIVQLVLTASQANLAGQTVTNFVTIAPATANTQPIIGVALADGAAAASAAAAASGQGTLVPVAVLGPAQVLSGGAGPVVGAAVTANASSQGVSGGGAATFNLASVGFSLQSSWPAAQSTLATTSPWVYVTPSRNTGA